MFSVRFKFSAKIVFQTFSKLIPWTYLNLTFLFVWRLRLMMFIRRLCSRSNLVVESVFQLFLVRLLTEVKKWLDVQLETLISIAQVCPNLSLWGAFAFRLFSNWFVVEIKHLAEVGCAKTTVLLGLGFGKTYLVRRKHLQCNDRLWTQGFLVGYQHLPCWDCCWEGDNRKSLQCTHFYLA